MTGLAFFGTCTLDQSGCITCGNVGIPVRVIHMIGKNLALCEDLVGRQAEMATAFTQEVEPGDALLIHMGIAIDHLRENCHE